MAGIRTYLRDHTLLRHLAWALVAALALLAVTASLSPFRNYQLATMAAYLCATVGMALLVGLTGQLSLGHGALMATGAYTCALMSSRLSDAEVTGALLLLVPLLAGIVAAAAVGALVGIAGARLHGPYLAGLTLALTISVPAVATTFVDVLGGDQGISTVVEPAPEALGATFPLEQWQAWVCCLAALLTFVVVANLASGRFGREMRAVRDDEVAARLSGIDVRRTKVLAFVVSAATAGLAGGLLAVITQAVSPGAYGLELSLFLVMAVVVGGLGSLAGAVWGAALLVVLPALATAVTDSLDVSPELAAKLDGNLALLLFGLVLALVPILMPRGVHGAVASAIARRSPRRRSNPVPPASAPRAEAAPTTEKQKDPPASLAEDSAVPTTKSSE